MKKIMIPSLIGLAVIALLSGCVVGFNFGGGKKDLTSTTSSTSNTDNNATNNSQHPATFVQTVAPTIGQQLIDLKKAKDSGAITEAEYEAEKAKILSRNK